MMRARPAGTASQPDPPAIGAADRPIPLPRSGRLLALDCGARRIGLAISDPTQTVAQPLATLTRRAGRRFPLQQLRPHLDAYRPVGILVGLPLDPEGREGAAAQAARQVGQLLATKTGLPVAFADERLTTARVVRDRRAAGATSRRQAATDDQLAATVLLQAYLDRQRP